MSWNFQEGLTLPAPALVHTGGKRESIGSGKRTLVRIDRTINEEEVDLLEHEYYTVVSFNWI